MEQERNQISNRIEEVIDLVNQKKFYLGFLKDLEKNVRKEIIDLDKEAEELYTKLYMGDDLSKVGNG